MKFFLVCFMLSILAVNNPQAQQKINPADANAASKEWFRNARFGLFIHWGPFSIPGAGEWVMNNRNISVGNYERLKDFFNPVKFDAREWVSLAKQAGMKYITFITRHHDGFSMWDTKASDFNIMNSLYGKDILKMLADECHRQGIKLFVYYSLLDWRREDYQYWTGRTGKGTGRINHGEWKDYVSFMKQQLTELLSNYGEIAGVWFDGHWDQVPWDEKNKKWADSSLVNWHYDELYGLIHRLQPGALIGNNHHLKPFPGEDFQMFERDLPGQNTTGWGTDPNQVSALPLETCETINGSWGFDITDTAYKTHRQLTALLVRAAGNGANLLLNVGPMPNGQIQPEFVERLKYLGNWMKTYGASIYGTHRGFIKPQEWGSITEKDNKVFLHILNEPGENFTLAGFPYSGILKAVWMKNGQALPFQLNRGTLILHTASTSLADNDIVIELQVKK